MTLDDLEQLARNSQVSCWIQGQDDIGLVEVDCSGVVLALVQVAKASECAISPPHYLEPLADALAVLADTMEAS